MPFVNRFASPFAPPPHRFGMVRNHPIIVASSAATAGVLLGAFIAVQLLATPEKVDAGAASPQAAVDTKPAPPIAETTGSAASAEPARSDVATADCDKQTWPYLSRDCMENGGARVISTDKLNRSTIGAIEGTKHPDAATPAPALSTPTTSAPSVPSTSAVTASNPPPAAPEAAAATPEPAPMPASAVRPPPEPAQTAAKPAQTAAKPELKAKPKHVAKKQKRKPAKQELNGEDDDNTVASDDSDDRFNDRRTDRRRVVQRWNGRNRDYDRRESDDDGQRRVIVIRRGGGLFGGLFGGNFGGDDDD